jgi:hypothetical protein
MNDKRRKKYYGRIKIAIIDCYDPFLKTKMSDFIRTTNNP